MRNLPAPRPRQQSSSPSWIVTFADLATLLLTFFILLMSFAEMDVEKYRAMAQSMASAFGSSVIMDPAIGGSPLTLIETDAPPPPPTPPDTPQLVDDRAAADPAVTVIPGGVTELARRMISQMEAQVADGSINVGFDTERVVIRFSEETTFQSGRADIKPEMLPILERVSRVLAGCMGEVIVSGHTDDRPIVGGIYRSNWDLSAARAVSVVHELVLDRQVPAYRVLAAGRAETHPLAPNDTAENRARNRRVEIAIRDPECDPALPGADLPIEILP